MSCKSFRRYRKAVSPIGQGLLLGLWSAPPDSWNPFKATNRFSRINVDTERGVVNLSGVVETEAQRARVERLTRQVEGVVRVNNNVKIENRPPSGKHPNPEQTNDMKEGQHEKYTGQGDQKNNIMQTQGVDVIQGEVVRVEGETYVVRGPDGKETSLHADTTTMKIKEIKAGDRVEVKIDRNNHALSMLPTP